MWSGPRKTVDELCANTHFVSFCPVVCYNIAMNSINYREIITIEPGKRGGKPSIRGMRITVYDVLSYLASGMTQEEILADFPYLAKEDILACLAFAADRERQMLELPT